MDGPAPKALVVARKKIQNRKNPQYKSEPARCNDNRVARGPVVEDKIQKKGRTKNDEIKFRRDRQPDERTCSETAKASIARRVDCGNRGGHTPERERIGSDFSAV